MPYHSAALDLAFHALSDPTRRAVISRLVDGELPVTALAEPFEMALPSFAQHLKVLEDCGLIASEKRGRSRWCRLERCSQQWLLHHPSRSSGRSFVADHRYDLHSCLQATGRSSGNCRHSEVLQMGL